jgi:lipopolysaccharide/colanic/teichoic acid biosynthesis glycosyltransferase
MYDSFMKRAIDVLISFILLVSLIPVFIALLVLIKLDSSGPFLFVQVRVGRYQKAFHIYKIRTMDAKASIKSNDVSQEYITTSKNDLRITKIGLILRKLHLDELPQLVNVIVGDMSLVGVRPDAPSQKKDYHPCDWEKRHLMRPGITGLSQIHSADSDYDFSLRNKYDLSYVESEQRFWLDMRVFYKTFLKVFRGSGF